MGNVLEFFVKMKDMMSGGLVRMASTAQSTFTRVQGHIDRVTGRNRTLSLSFEELERKMRQAESTIRSSTIPSQIRAARRELAELQRMQTRHLGGAGARSGADNGFMGGIGRALLPAIGIAGAVAFGGKALNSGLQSQARQTSFEVMAGKESGTKLNNDLTKYAQDSIFGTEVYQNAQTMLGFGIAAKQVMPTLKMLGDVSMGDAQKLGSLTLAFSQVQAAGKLTGSDLLQFINAGFNPLQEISQKTGVSIGVLKKKMEDGAISADMVRQAFEQATGPGGRFFDMTNKIAQTDFGKWQAFQGQIEGFAMKIGGMLAPVLGDLITNYLSPFVDWLGTAATWIQQNWDWIGLLVTIIAGLAVGIGIVTAATQVWTAATAALNFVMALNPITLVVMAIAALVAGIIYAYNKFGAFRGMIYAAWEAVKGFGDIIKGYVMDRINGLLAGVSGLGKALQLLFKGEFSKAWETANQAAGDLLGVQATANAVQRAKDMGKNMQTAYNQGIAEVAKKGSSSTVVTPSQAATGSKDGSAAAASISSGGTSASGVAQGIAGGGPRTINISGVKFADRIEIHTAAMSEAEADLEARMEQMFLRILNSGASVQ